MGMNKGGCGRSSKSDGRLVGLIVPASHGPDAAERVLTNVGCLYVCVGGLAMTVRPTNYYGLVSIDSVAVSEWMLERIYP